MSDAFGSTYNVSGSPLVRQGSFEAGESKAAALDGQASALNVAPASGLDVLFGNDHDITHPNGKDEDTSPKAREMLAARTSARMAAVQELGRRVTTANGKPDTGDIEILVNLTVRQDEVGREAEGILFNLFSGAASSSDTADEVARQSLKLYEYAKLTFSIDSSGNEPAAASGAESKAGEVPAGGIGIGGGKYVSKYLHDFRESVIDVKSSSFPLSSRFLYMAGAGAHAEAEKARAALGPTGQVYSAAEKDARRANEAADAALAASLAQGHPAPSRSQELVNSQTALDHAREQFEGAKTHAKEAGDLVAEIGGWLVANGALGPEIKHKPASLWDRGRFLDNKEVEAAIKGALTESSGAERFFYPEGAVYLADLDNGMLDSNLSSIRTETSLNFPVQVHDHWVLINARRKIDKADWQLTAFSSERAYSADSGRTRQSYFKDKNVEKLISALREKLGVKSPTAFAEYNLQGQGAPNTCGLYVALAIKALATDPQASAKEVFDGVAVTYARTDSRKQFNIDQRRQLFGTMVNQAESEAKAKVGDAREQRRPLPDRFIA